MFFKEMGIDIFRVQQEWGIVPGELRVSSPKENFP